jgi:hypothetical protein
MENGEGKMKLCTMLTRSYISYKLRKVISKKVEKTENIKKVASAYRKMIQHKNNKKVILMHLRIILELHKKSQDQTLGGGGHYIPQNYTPTPSFINELFNCDFSNWSSKIRKMCFTVHPDKFINDSISQDEKDQSLNNYRYLNELSTLYKSSANDLLRLIMNKSLGVSTPHFDCSLYIASMLNLTVEVLVKNLNSIGSERIQLENVFVESQFRESLPVDSVIFLRFLLYHTSKYFGSMALEWRQAIYQIIAKHDYSGMFEAQDLEKIKMHEEISAIECMGQIKSKTLSELDVFMKELMYNPSSKLDELFKSKHVSINENVKLCTLILYHVEDKTGTRQLMLRYKMFIYFIVLNVETSVLSNIKPTEEEIMNISHFAYTSDGLITTPKKEENMGNAPRAPGKAESNQCPCRVWSGEPNTCMDEMVKRLKFKTDMNCIVNTVYESYECIQNAGDLNGSSSEFILSEKHRNLVHECWVAIVMSMFGKKFDDAVYANLLGMGNISPCADSRGRQPDAFLEASWSSISKKIGCFLEMGISRNKVRMQVDKGPVLSLGVPEGRYKYGLESGNANKRGHDTFCSVIILDLSENNSLEIYEELLRIGAKLGLHVKTKKLLNVFMGKLKVALSKTEWNIENNIPNTKIGWRRLQFIEDIIKPSERDFRGLEKGDFDFNKKSSYIDFQSELSKKNDALVRKKEILLAYIKSNYESHEMIIIELNMVDNDWEPRTKPADSETAAFAASRLDIEDMIKKGSEDIFRHVVERDASTKKS